MSPSTAAAAARAAEHERAARLPRGRAPAAPRRVSGPLRPHVEAHALALSDAALSPAPRLPSRPPLRLASGSAAIALRVAEAAMEVSGSRTMDRLVRSRAWVVIVAFGLIGIVAMQVSLLKLNAGIGRAVETAATLERGNATLRGEVSRLSSGDRIQALAGARGFVMPEPGDVTYLRAGAPGSDGVRAARRMQAPDPSIAGPAGSATMASTIMGPSTADPAAQPAAAVAGVAPAAATAPAATTPAAATAPAGTTAPAVATAPAPQPTTPTPAAPATAAAVPAASSTGGAVP